MFDSKDDLTELEMEFALNVLTQTAKIVHAKWA
jgi:hypothetical protein